VVKPGLEGGQRLATLAVADKQHGSIEHVTDHRQVLLPALAFNPFMANVNLIYPDDPDPLHVDVTVFLFQPAHFHIFDGLPVQIEMGSDGADGHRVPQFQDRTGLGGGEEIRICVGHGLALPAIEAMDPNL
jgi:hypothetical protein